MNKRVFVTIEISEEARRKTAKYTEFLRKTFPKVRVSWEKAEKLHLTLKFLGEIEDSKLAKLIVAVEKTSRQITEFKLQITETGVFPKPANAKVLWIDTKDTNGEMFHLNRILENECEKQGFKRETRGFKPHLTIARLREPANSKDLIENHLREKFEPVEFKVSEIVIYESVLYPQGSTYEKYQTFLIGRM